MKIGRFAAPLLGAVRGVDARWHRIRSPHVRQVVFDARNAMDYGMMAPVHRRLLADSRVRTWVMSSEHPDRAGTSSATRHEPRR